MNKKTTYKMLAGVGAGLLIIPLARFVIKKMKAARATTEDEGTPVVNHLFSAYRGKHKPHHRKAASDGESIH